MLCFRVQDRVSPVSSRLWLMLLPSGLLSDLADISKLLVSRLQIEKLRPGGRSFVIDLLFPFSQAAFLGDFMSRRTMMGWRRTGT